MLASPAKKDSSSEERLRDLISSDVNRKERLRTQNSESIVIEESKQNRHSGSCGETQKAAVNGNGQ